MKLLLFIMLIMPLLNTSADSSNLNSNKFSEIQEVTDAESAVSPPEARNNSQSVNEDANADVKSEASPADSAAILPENRSNTQKGDENTIKIVLLAAIIGMFVGLIIQSVLVIIVTILDVIIKEGEGGFKRIIERVLEFISFKFKNLLNYTVYLKPLPLCGALLGGVSGIGGVEFLGHVSTVVGAIIGGASTIIAAFVGVLIAIIQGGRIWKDLSRNSKIIESSPMQVNARSVTSNENIPPPSPKRN